MALLRTLILLFGIVSLSHAQLKAPDKKKPTGQVELVALDGKKLSGEIVAIDSKELVFKTVSGANQTFELTKLDFIQIGKESGAPPKGIEVELIDGSQFHCSDFEIKDKSATLTLLGSNLVVELPIATLLYMVRDVSDPKVNQAFRGILTKRGKRDIWIIQKPDGSIDGVSGTFGDGDAKGENIGFEHEANSQKISIQTSRIFGMIFNPPPMPVAQTVCKVIDVNKNAIFAKSLTISPSRAFTVESLTGVKVAYTDPEAVAKLDFSAGSVLYLSSAEPIKVEQSDTSGTPEPYRRDRNLDNNDLKINNTKYPRGLALHSRTVLTYDLGGKYKRFEATAGVDDCVEGESKATLIIEADFKEVFKGVILKGRPPTPLSLAVLNVKQLRITVDSDFLDLGNQVDLVDAKVLK